MVPIYVANPVGRRISNYATVDKCLLLLTSSLPPVELLQEAAVRSQHWVKTEDEATQHVGCQRYTYELQGMQLIWKQSVDSHDGLPEHWNNSAPLEFKFSVWARSAEEAQDRAFAAATRHLEHLGAVTKAAGFPELAVEPLDIPSTEAGQRSYIEECFPYVPKEAWGTRPRTIINTWADYQQIVQWIMEQLPKAEGPQKLNSYTLSGLPKKFWKYIIGWDEEFCKTRFLPRGQDAVAMVQIALHGHVYLIQIWECMRDRFGICNAETLSLTLQELKPIVDAPWIKKCGTNIWNDMCTLQRCADDKFELRGIVDLDHVAKKSGFRRTSLCELCALLLGYTILKGRRQGREWNSPSLEEADFGYAADDTMASREVALRMLPAIVHVGEFQRRIQSMKRKAAASSSASPNKKPRH